MTTGDGALTHLQDESEPWRHLADSSETAGQFPILPDASGKLAYVAGDDNVEQSLALLLMTQLNERVMRPTFGCAAPSYIFAPGSVQFLNLLQETVSNALTLWEPRVDVLRRGRRGRPGRPVAGDGLGELPGTRDQLAVEPGLPVLPGIDRGTVMTLDPVVLDDLTWDDFNAAALQRIPAASGGLWTLNAPVDPGITLLDFLLAARAAGLLDGSGLRPAHPGDC